MGVWLDSEKVHPKQAIQGKNKWMVDRSDLVAFWVERENGGTYKTMKYVEQCEKNDN